MNKHTEDLVRTLAYDLGELADQMYQSARDMRSVHHAGGPDELADHADELQSAAACVIDWAKGLVEEA